MLHHSLTAGATTVSADLERSASFDREGRLLVYSREKKTWRRSLASEVYLRVREPRRRWQRLAEQEALEVFASALELARELLPEAPPALAQRLGDEVLPWTPGDLLAEEERFAWAYRPISILPPDQYLSIVLQATEGCTWRGCTFCNFYSGRPFAVKDPPSFARHAAQVRDLLGRGALLRRGLFLGDGNALALSLSRLEPLVEIARRTFPGRQLYGFVDLYGGERHAVEEWRHLAGTGLARVYVGMETGLDELLAFVNKPGSREELLAFVEMLKRTGLAVSLIVMVGLGGREYRERHARATVDALAAMPLGRGDLVYLSPFVEEPGSVYRERRLGAGLSAMDEAEIETELAAMARAIRAQGVQVSRYDIRELIY